MNATTIIIILLFVVTILNVTLGGKAIKSGGGPPVFSTIEVGLLPDPSYFSVVHENLEEKIEKFILSYSKKTSVWDASFMSQSMVKYGERYDVNPKLICALIARESAFNPFSVSSSGAQGLGQLKPDTAASLDVINPFDIDQNIMGTTRYFKLMLDRWNNHPQQVALALASYAEGYGSISRNGGYTEKTKGYIEDIIRIYSMI